MLVGLSLCLLRDPHSHAKCVIYFTPMFSTSAELSLIPSEITVRCYRVMNNQNIYQISTWIGDGLVAVSETAHCNRLITTYHDTPTIDNGHPSRIREDIDIVTRVMFLWTGRSQPVPDVGLSDRSSHNTSKSWDLRFKGGKGMHQRHTKCFAQWQTSPCNLLYYDDGHCVTLRMSACKKTIEILFRILFQISPQEWASEWESKIYSEIERERQRQQDICRDIEEQGVSRQEKTINNRELLLRDCQC